MKKFNAIIKEPNELEFTGAVYLFAGNITAAIHKLNEYGIQTDLITEISEDPEYNDDPLGIPSDAELMNAIYPQTTQPEPSEAEKLLKMVLDLPPQLPPSPGGISHFEIFTTILVEIIRIDKK